MKLKTLISFLFLFFLFTAFAKQDQSNNTSGAQSISAKTIAATKDFFKRNELIVGTSTVLVCCVALYFTLKKKKRRTNKIDFVA